MTLNLDLYKERAKLVARWMSNRFGADIRVGGPHTAPRRDYNQAEQREARMVCGEEANQRLTQALGVGGVFVGRWGSVEYGATREGLGAVPWYEEKLNRYTRRDLCKLAGFFPLGESKEPFNRFAQLYARSSSLMTHHCLWGLPGDISFSRQLCSRAQVLDTAVLSPWQFENPWTTHLKGKRVLVVHPFVRDMKRQWRNREKIFENPSVLPSFTPVWLEALQRNAAHQKRFSDWFAALEWMLMEAESQDFDFALVGCGAFGIPLGAHLFKSRGVPVVHMAGNLQLLFGLRGKRWDISGSMDRWINECWSYPEHNLGGTDGIHVNDHYGRL